MMTPVIWAIAILSVSAVGSWCCGRHPRCAHAVGAAGAMLGCFTGLVPAIMALRGGPVLTISLPWNVPLGSFIIRLDALSAFFLLPVFGLSAVAALYGTGYLKTHRNHLGIGASWFFFNLLTASMAMVVLAGNGILFLFAWEIMSLTSFFLVTAENDIISVRQAGWTYLVATHTGTAFLLVMFLLLGRASGSLDFETFAAVRLQGPFAANSVFLLAVIGFGTKAGFVPFHVWLPEAHPAAPSHVSALMSGVMIKTGIYGLMRTLTFMGPPEGWWGWLLVGLGLVSGVLGVLYALSQHDFKRLLAYHSVENIGIIGMGLGLGILGAAFDQPSLAMLGFAGGMLHVLNHALFKGLLFMGAGAVLTRTGTREIDLLGGLIKRMPWTATLFLIGAVAICGLPPLNGFISEFLIYVAAFKGAGHSATALSCAAVIVGLAMIGALAVACFTKVFGVVFLGEPRSHHPAQATEVGGAMRAAMLLLASGCLAVSALAPQVLVLLEPVIALMLDKPASAVRTGQLMAFYPLQAVVWMAALLLVVIVLLAWVRRRLLAGRDVTGSVTWDCGYVAVTARMQYTASSFAQPLTRMFGAIIGGRRSGEAPDGLFPAYASLTTANEDIFRQRVYGPAFQWVAKSLRRLHWIQQGRVQLYLLYIAATLFVLLLWNLK